MNEYTRTGHSACTSMNLGVHSWNDALRGAVKAEVIIAAMNRLHDWLPVLAQLNVYVVTDVSCRSLTALLSAVTVSLWWTMKHQHRLVHVLMQTRRTSTHDQRGGPAVRDWRNGNWNGPPINILIEPFHKLVRGDCRVGRICRQWLM